MITLSSSSLLSLAVPDIPPSPSSHQINNKSKTASSYGHKLCRQEELKVQDKDTDDESFQRLVDKRCVENVRMLVVDSVQHGKTGHPGMAVGMAEVLGYICFVQACGEI